jgi:hypothetical protein
LLDATVALKVVYQGAPPEGNEGAPIQPDSFMLVSITNSFLGAVLVAGLQMQHVISRRKGQNRR